MPANVAAVAAVTGREVQRRGWWGFQIEEWAFVLLKRTLPKGKLRFVTPVLPLLRLLLSPPQFTNEKKLDLMIKKSQMLQMNLIPHFTADFLSVFRKVV